MSPPQLIDSAWTLTMALLVFVMHGGFGFYEAGMCRSKNAVDALSHNLTILAVTLILYWTVGFGLMFGAGGAFSGSAGFVPRLTEGANAYPGLAAYPVPLAVSFAFAMSFADTPATLIAGTGAERVQFTAVVVLTGLISGVLFPIVGHWIVGGGWLATRSVPAYDTGSGMVQLCGGCCALAVGLRLGPRLDSERPAEKAHSDDEQVSSMPMVFLGTFILWLGFMAFNSGLAMSVSRSTALIVVNTGLAGAAGAVVALLGVRVRTGKLRLRPAMVGVLTANVAITSPSAVVTPWAAAVIGSIAGIATVLFIPLWPRLRLDDPTEYLTMNVVGGVLGLLAVALFASPDILAHYPVRQPPRTGLVYGGDGAQLRAQLLCALAIIVFVVPSVYVCASLLHRVGLLRVPPGEERRGADRASHGEKGSDQEGDDDRDGGDDGPSGAGDDGEGGRGGRSDRRSMPHQSAEQQDRSERSGSQRSGS
jgi:Amt family ammonium transporter